VSKQKKHGSVHAVASAMIEQLDGFQRNLWDTEQECAYRLNETCGLWTFAQRSDVKTA